MSSAGVDKSGTYRYWLSRSWLGGTGAAAFILLNPSTADASEDDPTIRRCIRFAQRWGFAGVEVVNLFAYRATDPSRLKQVLDPVGPNNDHHIFVAACKSETIVAAWGANGGFRNRDKAVMALLGDRPVFCLGRTENGHPGHPLYVPYSQALERYP